MSSIRDPVCSVAAAAPPSVFASAISSPCFLALSFRLHVQLLQQLLARAFVMEELLDLFAECGDIAERTFERGQCATHFEQLLELRYLVDHRLGSEVAELFKLQLNCHLALSAQLV